MPLFGRVGRALPPAMADGLRVGRDAVQEAWQWLRSVDGRGLARALQLVGVRPGSLLFVHSAYDQMRSIRATPLEVIAVLGKALGAEGTIAMPTFPMSGRSQDHLDASPVFDCRRTPSRAGLLTEVFRRMPGTIRSLHPTHAVAARGPEAEHITRDHARSATPFDEHSPFQRLLDGGADILSLGSFEAMSFRHLADHLIQDRIAHPIYSGRPIAARVVDHEGVAREVVTQGHNPLLHCDYAAVLARMTRDGQLRSARAGQVPLFRVSARDYVAAYHRAHADGLVRHWIGPR